MEICAICDNLLHTEMWAPNYIQWKHERHVWFYWSASQLLISLEWHRHGTHDWVHTQPCVCQNMYCNLECHVHFDQFWWSDHYWLSILYGHSCLCGWGLEAYPHIITNIGTSNKWGYCNQFDKNDYGKYVANWATFLI